MVTSDVKDIWVTILNDLTGAIQLLDSLVRVYGRSTAVLKRIFLINLDLKGSNGKLKVLCFNDLNEVHAVVEGVVRVGKLGDWMTPLLLK